ncbi:tetratricopeptide repeat protein [Lacticaseibacillus mingshuiensis]|uniref:Tetratricopeptide repeat protein n=1 Tax=Lacticaseibacillus mingshuiensis TaxID=2799574 RepID=A0ABW4CL48_9LACO|nr:tetratricopeptide repeat protein [Lacticaseibacillus mingshuiensis]
MTNDLVKQFQRGDHDEAIHRAVQAIDDHPHDPKNYATLAMMLISISADDEARELLVQALGLFPNDPELLYDFGVLAYTQGNDQLALSYFQQVTGAKGTLGEDAQYMTALAYQRAGQPAKALAFALTAHEAAPHKVDAALLCAQLMLAVGAFTQADEVLAPLLARKNARVLFTYGMSQAAQGMDGSQWLDEAKQLDPAGYDQDAGHVRDIAGFLKAQGDSDD